MKKLLPILLSLLIPILATAAEIQYGLIDPSGPSDLGVRARFEEGQQPILDHKTTPLKWVPVIIQEPTLVINPNIEKYVFDADLVTTESITRRQKVVALTAQELDQIARRNKLTSIGNKVATLRTWAEQARNVTVTGGNAVTVLQQVVDNLAVFYDGFADLLEGQNLDQ